MKGHGEPTAELEKRRILVDGAPTEGQGLLLQIFTQNVIGPIFFEIIQRKGNEGFQRAISRRCSNRSNSTRSAAGWFERR